MGYKLVREMWADAPGDLTPGEMLLLVTLADYANDETREGYPGIDAIAWRARMSRHGVASALRRLVDRGIELRVPIGKTAGGRAVYAHAGARTTYRIPRFGLTTVTPSDDPKGVTTVTPFGKKGSPQTLEGVTTDSERGHHSDPHTLIEPSLNPQRSSGRGRADALARLLKYTDEDDTAAIALELIDERSKGTIRNLDAYLAKIEDDGEAGITNLLDEAQDELYRRIEEAERADRAAFNAAAATTTACDHGYPGGHTQDRHGWVSCPFERKRLAAGRAAA